MTAELPRFRIFISSPGDVEEERHRAVAVISQVQRYFQGRCVLESYLWENEPMLATSGFQDQIDRPSKCDLAVFILWSRLGTPLSKAFQREDGHLPTGTEWEFFDARAAHESDGTPDLLVYRRQGSAPIVGDPTPDEYKRMYEQREAVSAFFGRWFRNEDDTSFTAAFSPYDTPDAFGRLLVDHLTQLLERKLADRDRAVGWKGSPFKGLVAFGYDDAPIFFGRARATHELVQHLSDQVRRGVGFVLVLGMSGSGKSSLVRAGLLPLLERPDVVDPGAVGGVTRRAVMRPGQGATPFHALAAALVELHGLPSLGDAAALDTLAEDLTNPEAACALIAHDLRSHGDAARLILVVDQLEELFTTKDLSQVERTKFLELIDGLVRHRQVWVVATLRSDFYHHVQSSPILMALKQGAGSFDLTPPTTAEIGQMIRHPAQVAGLKYAIDASSQHSLAQQLESEAAASPEALPLLQFVLEQLHERRDGITLTHEAYATLGGLDGAIATRAEEVFLGLPQRSQDAFQDVMRHLVEMGGEGEATRRYADKNVLTSVPGASELVGSLVDARLFTSDQSAGGTPVVSIAHEALLRRWGRLLRWLETDGERLAIRSRMEAAAAQWAASGRENSMLLASGKPLGDAQDLLTAGIELDESERAFIHASEQRARGRARLRRLAVITISVLAVGAGVLALVATGAKQDAQSALERVLRLSDSKDVRDLLDEAEQLWPVHPDSAPRMRAWAKRVDVVLKNRAEHEEAVALLRTRALPYRDAQRLRDHAKALTRIERLRDRIQKLRVAHKGLDAAIETADAKTAAAAKARQARMVSGIARYEAECARLDTRVTQQVSWQFEADDEAWRHGLLVDLLAGLTRLRDPDNPSAGLLNTVSQRAGESASLAERSIKRPAAAWAKAAERVKNSSKYQGLRLTPQLGLVPLGTDPSSALEEFAHLGSGTVPTRDPSGVLQYAEDAAIILVLVPGGSFHMGSQKDDPSGPNHDPAAQDDESLRLVTLSPYFIGKHELTQSQWKTMTDETPSTYAKGRFKARTPLNGRNPVEQVSWEDCQRWLPRYGLGLPTEAQWECAARGGTDTWWSVGNEVADLANVANLCDQCAKRFSGQKWLYESFDDGFLIPAPVGSLGGNGFSLHDVHGNLWEWCRDTFREKPDSKSVEDPLVGGLGDRVVRGASWMDVGSFARSANRYRLDPKTLGPNLGARAARPLSRD